MGKTPFLLQVGDMGPNRADLAGITESELCDLVIAELLATCNGFHDHRQDRIALGGLALIPATRSHQVIEHVAPPRHFLPTATTPGDLGLAHQDPLLGKGAVVEFGQGEHAILPGGILAMGQPETLQFIPSQPANLVDDARIAFLAIGPPHHFR